MFEIDEILRMRSKHFLKLIKKKIFFQVVRLVTDNRKIMNKNHPPFPRSDMQPIFHV